MDKEVRGTINTVSTTNNQKPRHYSMSSDVVFSTLDNEFGSVLAHVGKDHVQVVVTVRGNEVFRQVWK